MKVAVVQEAYAEEAEEIEDGHRFSDRSISY